MLRKTLSASVVAIGTLFCIPALAQSAPPPPADGQPGPGGPGAPHSTPTERLEAAVDAKRLPMLEELLPVMSPNCPINASKQDVKEYLALWRKRTGEPAGSPQDIDAAKVQIHIWRMYHCVATYYDGQRYISTPEITGGAPDMGWLEPADALAQFFHAARDKGLLHFSTDKENEYFFKRYDDPHFSNMYDRSKAFAWFQTPPWATSK